jgi:hypothetical protein
MRETAENRVLTRDPDAVFRGRPDKFVAVAAAVGAGIVLLAGCSDGGLDGGGPPVVGRHAYVASSAYRVTRDGGTGVVSDGTHTFTLVLDADEGVAIIDRTAVPLLRLGNRKFATDGRFSVGLTGTQGCSASISYDELTITVGDTAVAGTGKGTVTVIFGDVGSPAAADMSLTGSLDTVPPSVTFFGTSLVNPLFGTGLGLSEPIPPGATAELRTAGADPIALVPILSSDGRVLSGFRTPAVVLRYGVQYEMFTSGLLDFAGNPASHNGPFKFTTRDAPPLVAEDGFESAPDGPLGGALVISGAGAPVLAGSKSMLLPALPEFGTASSLYLRIALGPGDQVVRFSYRVVALSASGYVLSPTLLVGAVGAGTGALMLAPETGPFTSSEIPNQPTMFVGAVKTAEIPIPAGSTGELVIERAATSSAGCGLPPPPAAGLIIDDLRAE